MAQQALTSPFELTTGTAIIAVNYDGGGATDLNMTNGTYANPLTALHKLNAILAAHDANLSAYLNTTYNVVIASADASFTLVWNDSTFMTMLGFEADFGAGTTNTAPHTIGKTWIPPYYSADINHAGDDTEIKGSNAVDGTFSGIRLSPGLYTRRHKWEAVAAKDVYKSACVDSFAEGGTTYYPEEERCLEQFSLNALSASPTGTEGLSIKGCYYIEDLDDYVGAGNLPASMAGGGHRFQLSGGSATADNYIFCHLRQSRWTEPTPTLPNHNSLYNVGVELISAVGGVPTWSAPA